MFVRVEIDAAMRERARRELAARAVNRTRASQVDGYVGVLGELTWARLRYGSIEHFDTLGTRGAVDDVDVEVKTSKTVVSTRSHLMVREDYALKRAPQFYVLVLIPREQRTHDETAAFVCGWATHAEVLARAPIERISTHTGKSQGYRCYEVAARDLHPLRELPFELAGLHNYPAS